MLSALDSVFFHKLIDIMMSQGGDYADCYFEEDDLVASTIENNRIKSIKSGRDQGIHLRLIKGEKTYSAVTSDLSPQNLEQLAGGMLFGSHASPFNIMPISGVFQLDKLMPIILDKQESVLNHLIKTSQHMFKTSPSIVQVSMNYFESKKQIRIVNSLGLVREDSRRYERFTVQAIASEGSVVQTAYEGPGLTGDESVFSSFPLGPIANSVAERAVKMLAAEPAPSGRMPVILMGVAGGTMIHEACGHGFEADFIYKNTSIFGGKQGLDVASPLVTVIDDATLPHLFGSYKVDDEGVDASSTLMIEKGILKNYLTDRLSARLLNLPLTGNGRRESYHSKPVPRMSNTFIENGDELPDAIIDSVSDGLLVKRMGGGQVNITNGDFIFDVMEGYRIKNGKIDKPIRGASLIGNGPQVLWDIDRVGNDKVFIPGVCGKYDSVPVGDAQPTLRIKELTIGGQGS